MRTLTVGAVVAAATLVLLAGCSTTPRTGELLAPAELDELVDAINSGLPEAESYKATGDGEIALSGRTVNVAFAIVYEPPGWLRADLRPAYGSLGASLTTLALMEGECARMYMPARLLVVTACMSDLADYGEWIDPAALLLGLPDAAFLTKMTALTATRRGGLVTFDGLADGSPVRVKVDEERAVITEINLGKLDTDEYLSLTYSGHGWKPGTTVPRTVELVALEGESREVAMTIRYDSLRGGPEVDRDAYDLGVPPGALEIDWKELNIWR